MNAAAVEVPGCVSGAVLASSCPVSRCQVGVCRGVPGVLAAWEQQGPAPGSSQRRSHHSAALQRLLSGFKLWSYACRRLWP